jgi:hypothetical protein
MTTVQEMQPLVRECLGSHGDTVNGKVAQSCYIFVSQIVGITFHGDFKTLPFTPPYKAGNDLTFFQMTEKSVK